MMGIGQFLTYHDQNQSDDRYRLHISTGANYLTNFQHLSIVNISDEKGYSADLKRKTT